MTRYRADTIAGIALAVLLAIALGTYLTSSFPIGTTAAMPAGVSLKIEVVSGSSAAPMAGITVMAGPTTSPTDVISTPGGPTLSECVHQVPSGSSVEANGSVLYPSGVLITFPPCLLKQYVSDSSGMVSINNTTSKYYFIRVGNIMLQNSFVIGSTGTNSISLVVPWPAGNVTLTSLPPDCSISYGRAPSSGVEVISETCQPISR